MSRLKDLYNDQIKDAMVKKFGYKNPMEVPKLDKIVINMAIGEAKENSKILDVAMKELETIAGQKAVLTRAKKSIANFKIREGMPLLDARLHFVETECTSSLTDLLTFHSHEYVTSEA